MLKKIFYKLFKNKNNYREITRLEEYEKKYKKIIYDIDYAIKNNKELNFFAFRTLWRFNIFLCSDKKIIFNTQMQFLCGFE